MRKSLKNRVVRYFTAIILLFVTFTITVSLFSNGQLAKQSGNDAARLAREISNNINLVVYDKYENLLTFSELAIVQDALVSANNAVNSEQAADLGGTGDQIWQQEDAEGQAFRNQIINSELADNIRRTFYDFYQEQYGHLVYGEIFITDKYGRLISATNRTSDYWQADEQWWQDSLNEVVFSELQYEESLEEYVIEISFPVTNTFDEIIGVVNAALPIQDLFQESAYVLSSNLDQEVYLIDQQNRLLFANRPFNFLSTEFGDFFQTNRPDSQNFFQSSSDESGRIYGYAETGEYRKISNLLWTVVVANELGNYNQTLLFIRNLQFSSLALTLLFSLFVFGFAWQLINKVITPITRLSEIIQNVGQRNFNPKIDHALLQDETEIGLLAQKVKFMTSKLAEFYKSLELMVDSRTRELKAEKAKDEAIIDNIAQPLIVTNYKREIEIINEQALKLFELSKNVKGQKWPEVLGKFSIIHNNKKVSPTKWPVERSIGTGKVLQLKDYCYKLANGKTLFLNIAVSPIKLKSKVTGAVVIFLDLSKEHEIDRMKSEFISLASHQLLTPISAINWLTGMLLEGDYGKMSKDQTQVVTDIADSNQRMNKITATLLNVSRIESGRLIFAPTKGNIKDLITDLLQEVEPQIKTKKIKVREYLPSKKIQFEYDYNVVWEILKNILTNAIKYTPKAGNIEVTLTELKNDVLISIADTGIGIPKEDQDKIFTKFFRAQNVGEQDTDGNGLGLYLTQLLVKICRGKIWFDTKVNEGTVFHLQLPKKAPKARTGEVGIMKV